KVRYWREFAKHFKEKGWIDRLFNYVWDEPRPSDVAPLAHQAQLVHSADPSIRNMVTASIDPAWGGPIDIWSPLINCFENRSGFRVYCDRTVDRSAYDSDMQKGKRLWWYQSCASHGCNMIG